MDIDNYAAGLSKILSKGEKSEDFRITTFSPNLAAKLSQILILTRIVHYSKLFLDSAAAKGSINIFMF